MNKSDVTIALEDTSNGYEITPDRVSIAVLAEFSSQVKEFLRGSDRDIDPATTDVSVEKGSFAIRAHDMHSPRLVSDLHVLLAGFDMGSVDKRRRSVVKQWQEAATATPGRTVKIGSPVLGGSIWIAATTHYFDSSVKDLVNVERYVKGEIVDMGGAKEPNAHIKLPDGRTLIVRTDRQLIKAEKENHLYKTVHLRIKAKLDLDSGELSDAILMEFVHHSPRFDEQEFQKLTENGEAAWGAEVDSATWVRRLRGED